MRRLTFILGILVALLLMMGASSEVFAETEVSVDLPISKNILVRGNNDEARVDLLQQLKLARPELVVAGMNIRRVVVTAARTKATSLPLLTLVINSGSTDSNSVEYSESQEYALINLDRGEISKAVLLISNSTGLALDKLTIEIGAPDEVVIQGKYPKAPEAPAPAPQSAPVQPPQAAVVPPKAPAPQPAPAPAPQPVQPPKAPVKAPKKKKPKPAVAPSPRPPEIREPELAAGRDCYRIYDANRNFGYICQGDTVMNVWDIRMNVQRLYRDSNGTLVAEVTLQEDDSFLIRRRATDLIIINRKRLYN